MNFETYGDGGRLDGNASFLFVLSGVSESGLTGLAASDDTSFTVIDCNNEKVVGITYLTRESVRVDLP